MAPRLLAASVAICWKDTPSVERSKMKPVSSVELSCHVRLICVEEEGAAVKLLGAAGTPFPPPPPPPLAVMVTLSKLAMQTVPSLWLVTASPISIDELDTLIVTLATCVQLFPSADR